MPGWIIVLVIVILLLSASLLVIAQYYARSIDNRAQRRFYQLLEKNSGDAAIDKSWVNGVVRRMGQGRLVRWLPKIEHPETFQLLRQAGWYSYRGRVLFQLAGLAVPALIMFIIIVYSLLAQGGLNAESWAQLFIAGVLGYLLPKHLLRRVAKSRRNRLSREMPTAIHLLRMLFDAGLSTEHALRVLQKEGRLLTPELSGELIAVLRQIDAGLDPADALSEMAAPLEVNELSDTVAILKQVSRHGGNIRETLVKFAQLMEERQLSALREYVNVLSGKMSVVMMVFLFPALLIFLAGPGFIALAKGLMTL
jgi:tight adherence protein C